MSGGCRPGACSACHGDHSSIAGTAARRAGLGAWLAGLARDTGILSRICRTTRRNILLKPALSASCRKTNMTGNQSGCLVPPRTTLRGARGGSDAAGRQVIQRAAGFARTRRRPLSFPGLPDDSMCPGFPGIGLPDSGHATGWIWLARSSSSIGVSMPGDEWRPRRFRRDRFRRAGRGVGTRRPRCGPGAPARGGKASRIHPPRAGWPSHRRAGRLTAENLAGSPRPSRCARGHPLAPGEPWTARSACVTGSRAGPGTRPRPGCSLQPHSLAERGKFQLPGS